MIKVLTIILLSIFIAIYVVVKTINRYDKFESEFMEKHRGDFVNRFETDAFDLKHHYD